MHLSAFYDLDLASSQAPTKNIRQPLITFHSLEACGCLPLMRRICVIAMIFIFSGLSPALAAEELERQCVRKTASSTYFCLKEVLNELEVELNEAIEKSAQEVKSAWGEQANSEIRDRMRRAQEAWLIYRDMQCSKNYYSKAPTHPPSQDISTVMCKISKTKHRITEFVN